MPAKLTRSLVEKSTPESKPFEIVDAKEPGLRLRVQPSGKKSWIAVYKVDGRKTRRTLGNALHISPTAARTAAKEILIEAAKGIDVNAERRRLQSSTLAAFLDTHYSNYAETHIRTHRQHLATIRKQFSNLLERPMWKITELDMQRWRTRRAKQGVTIDTMRRELSTLQSALNTAVSVFKVLSNNPIAGYKLKQHSNAPIRKNQAKIRYLVRGDEDLRLREALDARDEKIRAERRSANQWRKERGVAKMPEIGPQDFGDHVTPIVLLALLTGMDRGDLFDLTWEQVDLKNRHIRRARGKIRRRSDQVWTLPLAPEAAEVLTRWSELTGKAKGRVFPSPVSGGRLDNIKKAWAGVLEDAEIKDFRFKDLRHTFASWLVQSGVDLYTVRDLLCHKSIKTTEIYAHLAPDQKAAAVNKVFGGHS